MAGGYRPFGGMYDSIFMVKIEAVCSS